MIRSVLSIIHRFFKVIRIRYLLLFIFTILMVTSCARPRTLNLAPAPIGSFDQQESYVELPSSIENASITGYLVRPSKDGRYPCVVLLHGKGGWWRAYIRYARKLASHGFSSLVINYYSVHQVDLEGLRTPFIRRKSNFERQNEDINRAVSAFAKSTHCIQNKVGLIGFSLGADKAFRAAASLPVVKAVVAYYGPYDYEALIKKRINAVILAMATKDLLRWKEYLEVHSPANKIQNTKASTLMFHGVTDRLIPVQQSFTMMRKLRARESGYAQLKLYEGTGHNFILRRRTPREREDSIRLALIFLKNHLSQATEPPNAQGVRKKRAGLHSESDKQDS
ncbi:MAG: prolyl oligopeptidase family serine peptidase [Nitrospinae bacterium]|nr:prolyl oligopeptidase family serine peptidase [Nitrospinota bacterium]